MKHRLMDILCCPYCKGKFFLKIFDKKSEEIVEGILLCDCGKIFPIINFIPRIYLNAIKEDGPFIKKYYNYVKGSLDENNTDSRHETKNQKNKESFEFEWFNYRVEMGNEQKIFLEETQISADSFNNKLVLDVGCGMGRYTRIPVQLGAEVVGMDLGLSVNKAYENLKTFGNCHIIQADLMFPPFADATFDIIYSLGVLHHTPDTKAAFNSISGLVKEKGDVSVWVYGKAGNYTDFITNPLRSDRKKFEKILYKVPVSYVFWLAVRSRELFSDLLRFFTTRIPLKSVYYFCHILSLLGKIPVLKYFSFSVLPNWKARVWENFDWLSPQFQNHHTKEEVISWFTNAGFAELKILPHGLIPKPGVKGRKTGL